MSSTEKRSPIALDQLLLAICLVDFFIAVPALMDGGAPENLFEQFSVSAALTLPTLLAVWAVMTGPAVPLRLAAVIFIGLLIVFVGLKTKRFDTENTLLPVYLLTLADSGCLLILLGLGLQLRPGQNPDSLQPPDQPAFTKNDNGPTNENRPFQFTLRSMLVWMTLLAVFLGALSTLETCGVLGISILKLLPILFVFAGLCLTALWAACATRFLVLRILAFIITIIALPNIIHGAESFVFILPFWTLGSLLIVRVAGYRLRFRQNIPTP